MNKSIISRCPQNYTVMWSFSLSQKLLQKQQLSAVLPEPAWGPAAESLYGIRPSARKDGSRVFWGKSFKRWYKCIYNISLSLIFTGILQRKIEVEIFGYSASACPERTNTWVVALCTVVPLSMVHFPQFQLPGVTHGPKILDGKFQK